MLVSACQGYPDRQEKLGSKMYSFFPSQVGNKCHSSQERGPGHKKKRQNSVLLLSFTWHVLRVAPSVCDAEGGWAKGPRKVEHG